MRPPEDRRPGDWIRDPNGKWWLVKSVNDDGSVIGCVPLRWWRLWWWRRTGRMTWLDE